MYATILTSPDRSLSAQAGPSAVMSEGQRVAVTGEIVAAAVARITDMFRSGPPPVDDDSMMVTLANHQLQNLSEDARFTRDQWTARGGAPFIAAANQIAILDQPDSTSRARLATAVIQQVRQAVAARERTEREQRGHAESAARFAKEKAGKVRKISRALDAVADDMERGVPTGARLADLVVRLETTRKMP
jgi:hypothetical protein